VPRSCNYIWILFGDFSPKQLKNSNFCSLKVFVSIVEKYNRVCYTDISNFPSNVMVIKMKGCEDEQDEKYGSTLDVGVCRDYLVVRMSGERR